MPSRFSPLTPPLPAKNNTKTELYGLQGVQQSLTLFNLARQHSNLTVIIADNTWHAHQIYHEVAYLAEKNDTNVLLFPDRETLPYDHFSPHQDIISDRLSHLALLAQTSNLTNTVVILSITSALVRLTPKEFLSQHYINLNVGDTYPFQTVRTQLIESGYRQVEQVYEHGEFAVRGALIDLFPMGSEQPFRIELFDDEIETIRTFDPETQRSESMIQSIKLLPAKEFPTNKIGIDTFRHNFRQRFDRISQSPEAIYQQVSRNIMPSGIEAYLPLFFERTETIFDYLPKETLILTLNNLKEASDQHLHEVKQRYENYNIDSNRPLLEPHELYLRSEEFFRNLKLFSRCHLHEESSSQGSFAESVALPNLEVNHQLKQPLTALQEYIPQQNHRILFSVDSQGRREVLIQLLKKIDIEPKSLQHIDEFLSTNVQFGIVVSPLSHGCALPEHQITIICESEIFGQQVAQQKRRQRQKQTSTEHLIRNLAELTIDDIIVHQKHGIGRYQGLEKLTHGDIENEFLILEYANADRLYVPMTSLHLISRYSGQQESIALNRLGGKQWDKEKRKAAEKVRDVAAELLDIYAQRALRKGESLKFDTLEYEKFASLFPFEETIDQANAIEAVLQDLEKDQPMDRLVCGDVGFGKTEVAMRAAFAAVQSNRQVAILVPTTLLAQQHYQNFLDRFSDWPIEIEVLSRFKTAKEQKEALERLHSGQIDLIVGTHKLLQNDIQFKDLGLLIVDEEHRFGVRHKEQIKRLRANVNILTMTATPIPRTLNMAMSGIRDLSIISTPPAKRLSVKTFVKQTNQGLIKEALLREILRGGQVYFLHNNVETIQRCAQELQELLPEARVVVAHGQMRERELERVMSDFYHQRYNILVCTTIIETGIDIPSANTIIIDRADRFGLAQLHQLRGRVGRSHHQAYAYLLTPPKKLLTKDAQKRLEAISAFDDLGVGFLLATQDLEIRGAGDFLGDEQSGNMAKIGFSLYMEMLEEAVEALKEGKQPSLDNQHKNQCDVDLKLPSLITEDYIRDINTRLSLYKRIASSQNKHELEELQVEMIDRFGLLPEKTKNLFHIALLKLQANQLGIEKIDMHTQGGFLEFREKNDINPDFIIGLLQTQPQTYRIDGANRLKLINKINSAEKRLQFIEHLLSQLQDNRLGETL